MMVKYHAVEMIFQNFRVRLKFSNSKAMKIRLFVALEIQYFEPRIFSFNSYVYYATRSFNLVTCAFNLQTRASNFTTRAFRLLTLGFELVTDGFELVTRRFELVTR